MATLSSLQGTPHWDSKIVYLPGNLAWKACRLAFFSKRKQTLLDHVPQCPVPQPHAISVQLGHDVVPVYRDIGMYTL